MNNHTPIRRVSEPRRDPIAEFKSRLKFLIAERGLNKKSLSKAAGLGETAVRDIFDLKKSPRIDTVMRLADQFGMSVGELLEGDRPPERRIPIIGCASAGEGWSYFENDDAIDEVLLAVGAGDAVGIEVRGNSMEPVYRNGDIIIGAKRAGQDARQLVGSDCIIETTLGKRFIKFIAKGSMRGRFNLKSYNPAHEDIRDVEINWAAPISLVIRQR
jgi:phage repressor protein C with HTH and peptisase S24 domain